jgi:hypothetical protein
MHKFTGLRPHHFRGEPSVNAAMALIGDKRGATDLVGDILIAEYGHLKGTTKHIARAADAPLRAAENWPQKRALPDVIHFLRIAQNTPRLNAMVTWLMQHGSAHPQAGKYLAAMAAEEATRPEEGDRA